jgi:O-antigen/teichoic acid export membrane protein
MKNERMRIDERIIKSIFASVIILLVFSVGGFIAIWSSLHDEIAVAILMFGTLIFCGWIVIKFYFTRSSNNESSLYFNMT